MFILDQKGKLLICRDYRGEVSLNSCVNKFAEVVVDQPESDVSPVFTVEGITYETNIMLLF